ncbi:8989_t:CDS:2 [Racocetra fulgida]|uniref:8989_t:CDS:1 n=1 Tax=Racocetra fulgida TaxID=60492 RepID=A0A9N8ZGF9_9GLOM|nr:8989_t:CDS:2 [Racocetra fulgida]
MSTSSLEIRTNHLTRSPISPSFSDVPGPRHGILIDIACIIITLLSLALFIALAALTGYYADIEDYDTANKLFISQNLAWFVWGSVYMIVVLYLWVKFVGVAWDNMSDLDRTHAIRSTELQTKFVQLKRGSPLSSSRSIIRDADQDNSDKYSQSNDRKQEETDNDIISEKIPQTFRRQSDSSISKQYQQRRSPSSPSPLSLRGLNDSTKLPTDENVLQQEMVLENPLSPLSPSSTIFDRRRSGNQNLKEWLLKKPTPAIPRPQRLDSYRESI